MKLKVYFFLICMWWCCGLIAQQSSNRATFELKGSVLGKENLTPISGVEVSTDFGAYAITNGLGEFRIRVAIGDQLVFRSAEFETVRYTVRSDEDVDVRVEGYVKDSRSSFAKKSVLHSQLLDSAQWYKKKNIKKSIDFITQSISVLGEQANKKELATSLTALGEVYQYHKQYDLAISNFKDALDNYKSVETSLLLGKAYNQNKSYKQAEITFNSLLKERRLEPYQSVQLYEGLGDALVGLGNIQKAVAFYNQGLIIAKKNQITPKETDLNSKIAMAYAKDNKTIEAEGYFNQSLKLAKKEAPKRAVQEKEKVADFYNTNAQFDKEIELRKENLSQINEISSAARAKPSLEDEAEVTSQKINYKIANAYIEQAKLDEAIPYLEKSITEADDEDDLVVQKDVTRRLSEVYEEKGEFSKAYETYQKYVAVVDSLYIRKEQEIAQAARFNRELVEKQSRITGLEQERELSRSKYDLALTSEELAIEANRRQQWVIYSLIFGMLLLGLTAFFFYRSTKQQKINNNLLALRSLRSQMNPHFIFNALNSVNNYIAKSDERSANRFLSEFSVLMRLVLDNSEEDFISLPKELELLELYVKLEHSRFPDKFEYSIKVDKEVQIASYQIPPMLLQPYIENAIWHGLRYKDEKGFLHIHIKQKREGVIAIEIQDNGIGRKKSAEIKTENQKKQKSKGMGNIKKRIAILNDMYKERIAVTVQDLYDNGTGTKVVLTLKRE